MASSLAGLKLLGLGTLVPKLAEREGVIAN